MMQAIHAKRKFTPEEKQQLLANLDFEVEHKIRQLESLLSDALSEFRSRHELQISRIPHPVRGLAMSDFQDKYRNDVTAAARGLQEQKLEGPGTLDRAAMKRKWAASQDEEDERQSERQRGERVGVEKSVDVGDGGRASKNPRMMPNVMTPQKKPPFAVGKSIRTPGTTRINPRVPSPSPSKFRPTFTKPPSSSRPASPSKPAARRPPSATTFNPSIPKGPQVPRWPRKDEMMVSVNGSPIANPYELGLGWLAEEGDDLGEKKGGANSGIVVRRDRDREREVKESLASSVASSSTAHSTTSNSNYPHPARTRTRTNSNSQTHIFPHHNSNSQPTQTPRLASAQARVAVPTKDGHTLEFDPLQTSPGALDRLEGITDSAKKQAREDMVKLVQTAVKRWNIT